MYSVWSVQIKLSLNSLQVTPYGFGANQYNMNVTLSKFHVEFNTSLVPYWGSYVFVKKNRDITNSTEYCRKISGIILIFHCNWNIVATFLLNIEKYFIATLKFQLSEIFLKTNKYLILLEIL